MLIIERNLIPLFLCEKRRGGITIVNPRGKNTVRMNEDIRFREVRLIDADGEMRGIVPTDQALRLAEESGLDLVLISPNPDNPVARIMDYGKFVFEQSKRDREAKKKQKVVSVKEVQIKLTTEEHDTNVKVRNALRFLKDGDRVRVVIRFRGREMSYQKQGYAVMEEFADACREEGKVDRPPRIEGRNMVMFLSPLTIKERKEMEARKSAQESDQEQTMEESQE